MKPVDKIDLKTLQAAVVGEEWAISIVVEHYADELDRLCTDGTGTVDQALRSEVIQDFIIRIMEFPYCTSS